VCRTQSSDQIAQVSPRELLHAALIGKRFGHVTITLQRVAHRVSLLSSSVRFNTRISSRIKSLGLGQRDDVLELIPLAILANNCRESVDIGDKRNCLIFATEIGGDNVENSDVFILP